MDTAPPVARFSKSMMIATPMLAVLAFLIVPLIVLVVLSLQDRQGFASDARFIGLQNYLDLARSEEFWRSAWWTLKYAVLSVAIQLLLGMGAALSLQGIKVGRTFVLAICLLPYALPTVVGCLAWRWMLSGEQGIVNRMGNAIGVLPASFSWFGDGMVLPTLVLVSVWMFTPFVVLMFYAKLASIPATRYEVAAVNGLSPVQAFLRVTLPEMRWVIAAVLILRTLWMASKFDVVWLMAGREAAGEQARSVPVLAYISGFQAGRLGYAAALSVTMLVVLLVLTLVAQRFLPSEDSR